MRDLIIANRGSNKCVLVRAGKPHPLRHVWVWLELLDGCCVAIFASVLPDASAIFWCERGRILARLLPFSFGCKALTVWFTSWSTLGDSCVLPLVGSSWAWPNFARKTFFVRSRIPTQSHGSKILYYIISASCTYHVTNVLHFNLLRKFISANQLIARS